MHQHQHCDPQPSSSQTGRLFGDWYAHFVSALEWLDDDGLLDAERICCAVQRMMIITGVWRRRVHLIESKRGNGGMCAVCDREHADLLRERYKHVLLWMKSERGVRAADIDLMELTLGSTNVTAIARLYKRWRVPVETLGFSRSPSMSLRSGNKSIFLHLDRRNEEGDEAAAGDAAAATQVESPPVELFVVLSQDFSWASTSSRITATHYALAATFCDDLNDLIALAEVMSFRSPPRATAPPLRFRQSESDAAARRPGVPVAGTAILDTSARSHVGWGFPRLEVTQRGAARDFVVLVELSELPTLWRGEFPAASISALAMVLQDKKAQAAPTSAALKNVLLRDFADCILACTGRQRIWAQLYLPELLIDILTPNGDADVELQTAALLVMWNITDTNSFVMRDATILRWLRVVNSYLEDLSSAKRLLNATDTGDFAQTLLGSLWNFLGVRETRRMVATECAPLLRNVVRFINSCDADTDVPAPALAFDICHLLAQLQARGWFRLLGCEADAEKALRVLIQHSLVPERATSVAHFRVSLSTRDMAVCFIPLLGLGSVASTAFASFVIHLEYFCEAPAHLVHP